MPSVAKLFGKWSTAVFQRCDGYDGNGVTPEGSGGRIGAPPRASRAPSHGMPCNACSALHGVQCMVSTMPPRLAVHHPPLVPYRCGAPGQCDAGRLGSAAEPCPTGALRDVTPSRQGLSARRHGGMEQHLLQCPPTCVPLYMHLHARVCI